MMMSPESPPLCDTMLTVPARCGAFSWKVCRPAGLKTPMQFGPRTRVFTSRAAAEQLVAQRRAVGADLVEAATDHVDERHPPRRRADDVRAAWRGHRDQQVVDRLVDLAEVGDRGNAVDLLGVGVQRVEIVVPPERAVRRERAVAEAAPRRRRAGDRDRARREQAGEVGRRRRLRRRRCVAQR